MQIITIQLKLIGLILFILSFSFILGKDKKIQIINRNDALVHGWSSLDL